MQKIAEQHGCHQCLWLFGADHEITEVANVPILIYSYILIYPNPDPDSSIPTLIPILIIPNPDPDSYIPSMILILIISYKLYLKPDPDSYILTLILMTIFILNLIPPGGRNEPFHPVGAS